MADETRKRKKGTRVRLNKTNVEKLTLPESGQVLVFDDELQGFAVRLTAGCKSYVVQRRINGVSRRITLGKHGALTAIRAREMALKVLAGFVDGIDPVVEKKRQKDESVTLRTVANDYIEDRDGKLKQSSINDINKAVDKLLAPWDKLPITSITRDSVAVKHTALSANSHAQADMAFRVLRALLNYARARYRPGGKPILPENPVEVLNRGQRGMWNKVKARNVRIPDDKIGVAWNCLQALRNDPAQTMSSRTNADLLTFLLLTGLRWSEAAELEWARVDLEKKSFHLPDPKNRQPITFPMSETAKEILAERPRINRYVFPARNRRNVEGHVSDARGAKNKLCQAIEVNITNHDLRRTFTNIGFKKCKIDLKLIKLLTNHALSDDVTIEHYGDPHDRLFLAPEAEQIAHWITEQGRIAAAAT